MATATGFFTVTDIADGATGPSGGTGPAGPMGGTGPEGTPADIYKTIYLFQNGTSIPSAPSSTQGFVASTGVALGVGGWTVNASVPPAGQIIYVASALLIQTGGSGNWAVSGNWSANPASASGSNGANGTNGSNGADGAPGATGPQGPQGEQGQQGDTGPAGADGTSGTSGSDAPRFGEATLYRQATSTPTVPSARITWSTGAIDNITSGWSQIPPTVVANSTQRTYSSRIVFIDTTAPFLTTTSTGSTPLLGFNFGSFVTFTGGDFAVDGSTITTIDGGNIATGSLTADKIAADAIWTSQLNVKSETSGERVEIRSEAEDGFTGMIIYNSSGNAVVRIGVT